MSDAVQVLLRYGARPSRRRRARRNRGGMSLALALGAALAASLPPDLVWYELGRRRGGRILGLTMSRLARAGLVRPARREPVHAEGSEGVVDRKVLPGTEHDRSASCRGGWRRSM